MDDLTHRIVTLATLRVSFVQITWQALYTADADEALELARFGKDYMTGVELLSRHLGLRATKYDLLNVGIHQDNPSECLMQNVLQDDKVQDEISRQYGPPVELRYIAAKWLFAAWSQASWWSHSSDSPDTNVKRAQLLAEYREDARILIEEALRRSQLESDWLALEFSPQVLERWRQIEQVDRRGPTCAEWFKTAVDDLWTLTMLIAPHSLHSNDRLRVAHELEDELRHLPSGRDHWLTYEGLIQRILWFLFVPPQREVIIQARTENGHERRDAIIPNIASGGFWDTLRREFETKHIVFEMKNSDSAAAKEDIIQLRTYLSKPTIGRFGVLVTRKGASKSAGIAQGEAYSQNRILALILDDDDVVDLMRARTFLGSPELALESKKIQFEVRF
jgi:hypothetical protein